MSRYINADKLKEFIATHDYLLSDKWNSTDNGMFTCGIMQAIDEQPTAAVREVVRCGECKYMAPSGRCSQFAECGFHNSNFDFNFCPNCGADMCPQLDIRDCDHCKHYVTRDGQTG